MVKAEFSFSFSSIGSCQSIWFNRNIRSKSKQFFFFYQDWMDRGIVYISDLLNPPHPGSKLFEELVLDFNISPRDRRKFNFLMKNIPGDWLLKVNFDHEIVFDRIKSKVVNTQKVPKFAYSIMLEPHNPEKTLQFWNDFADPNPVNWDKVHMNNFKCSINTRIRSFYLKLFHKAIALNEFLYKIKRKDSPTCSFCKTAPETYIHCFIECQVIKPIWDKIIIVINQKSNKVIHPSLFDKMFGYEQDIFLTYLFLLFKYYIYLCKFQGKSPNFEAFKAYVASSKDVEYQIAKKKHKLVTHFRKWRFFFLFFSSHLQLY